jgi:hypothetical protein
MLTDTANQVDEASVSALGTPLVLADVTKRYGRRRGVVPEVPELAAEVLQDG